MKFKLIQCHFIIKNISSYIRINGNVNINLITAKMLSMDAGFELRGDVNYMRNTDVSKGLSLCSKWALEQSNISFMVTKNYPIQVKYRYATT